MKYEIELYCRENDRNSYNSVEEFLKVGELEDFNFYTHFTLYYKPIIDNPELRLFLHNIYLTSLDTSLEDSRIPEIDILYNEVGDTQLTFSFKPVMVHCVYTLFLSFVHNMRFSGNERVHNYVLINTLTLWVKKYILKYHPKATLETKNLNFFFGKYLTMLTHYQYLKKVTDWINNHRAVFYTLNTVLKENYYDPYSFTGITFSPYSIKGTMIHNQHFSSLTNLYINNNKTIKTLKFNNLAHPTIMNQLALTVDLNLLDEVLEFLKSKIALEDFLPSQHLNTRAQGISPNFIKLNDLINFRNFLKKENTVFFAHSYDTRGRQYAISKFSITNCKYLRLCCINNNTTHENNKNSKTFKKIKSFFNLLEKYKHTDDNVNAILVFLFLGLGYLTRPKNVSRFGLSTFLKLGIEAYELEKIEKLSDIYDQAQYILHKFIIKEVCNKGMSVPNYMITKDATASGWQHLGLCLGVEEEYKRWLNLDDLPLNNEKHDLYWTDTYSKIIESFKEHYLLPIKYDQYFTRKLLKPLIMTINYGATYYKCMKDIKLATDLNDPEFYKYFQLFYEYVKNLPWFKTKPDVLKKHIIERAIFVFTDATIDIKLYKLKKKKHDYVVGNKRETIVFEYPTAEVDFKKTETAALANFIHASDSEVLRLMKYKTHAIHDCLLVGIKDICTILDDYEEALNKITSKKIFNNNTIKPSSIFLLI